MAKKPVVLVIMDGLANGRQDDGDGVFLSKTPTIDMLRKNYDSIEMISFGEEVGLPKGQMGNSEVGHTNLGAGRIIRQGLSRINHSLETGEFQKNEVILKAIKFAKENKGNLNLLGLVSPGGVHSEMSHIPPIVDMANKEGVKVSIHAFTDGRDVAPTSAPEYFAELEKELKGKDYLISTISGRYYAMDRDTRWERTQLTYDAITKGEGNTFTNPVDYIKSEHAEGHNDEFIIPAVNESKEGLVKSGDSVLFINYRPDRARQLSHAFIGSKLWDWAPENKVENIYFASMANYDQIECDVVFAPHFPKHTLGEWLDKHGKSQLRAAETEKYPHVTFFFDGGKEHDWKHGEKLLVNSPKVATYDLQPEMSAPELTDKILDKIGNFDVSIINYANPDMVGHTGVIPAVIKSIETTDEMVGKVYDKVVNELGGVMIITADHGNSDEMIDAKGNPMTKHSMNPVPVFVTSKEWKFKEKFHKDYIAKLGDIAPTMLTLLDMEIPEEMTGEVLIEKK